MIKKIPIEKANYFSKLLNQNTYNANQYYLAFQGFFEKITDEILLYECDPIYPNEFPTLKLPKNRNLWKFNVLTNQNEKNLLEIQKAGIKIKNSFSYGTEYYYDNQSFIEMKGKDFHSIRKAVNRFKKRYKYKIKTSYSLKKAIAFLKKWASSQDYKSDSFEQFLKFDEFCIKNQSKIPGKWLFVEINGELVGYRLSCQVTNDTWVGVSQKVDYKIEGLNRFLLHEHAKLHSKLKYFTLGIEANDEGIKNFKESLNPIRKEPRYFVVTTGKES